MEIGSLSRFLSGPSSLPVWAVLILACGGVAALCCYPRKDEWAPRLGMVSCILAMVLTLIPLLCPGFPAGRSGMAGYFRLPIALVGIAAALHSPGYLRGHGEGRMGLYWGFFNLTLSAMLAVTLARGFLGFLVAWELMGLFSFVLVAFDWSSGVTRRAAWIYLLACEAGGLLLMLLPLLMRSGSAGAAGYWPVLLAGMTAFGLKAGFPLLHVWLPEAHPAAPAPVSAVMSAAMIPLGFYGIWKFLPVTEVAAGMGWGFLGLGLIGALSGILFALAQRNLKALLAYSSVENIGIMALGMGLGLMGMAYGLNLMKVCGLAGAFLHILNHALLKGTLFLGAGTVFKSVHTLDMDRMGGLMKSNPRSGGIFCAAAFGICGLPPGCGFVSEFLIYLAAFQGMIHGSGTLFAASFAGSVGLALTGGLACAAFAKAVSAVFLGEPRTEEARQSRPETASLVLPLLVTGIPALLMPLLAPWVTARLIGPLLPGGTGGAMAYVVPLLWKSGLFVLIPLFLALLLTGLRRLLPRSGEDSTGPTWDCGYARPTARMEYTGTAFVQPLADSLGRWLWPHRRVDLPEGLFPQRARLRVEAADWAQRLLWNPLFEGFGRLAGRVHKFQSGYLHFYLLAMVLALLLMLLWGFACSKPAAPGAAVKTAEVRHNG